jgi:hypothetical protein
MTARGQYALAAEAANLQQCRGRAQRDSGYRKSLWADADVYTEIWLEKDALASVVYPVTSRIVVAEMVDVGRDR